MNIKKGRGYVYSLQYHIVWCTKYRIKVIPNMIKAMKGNTGRFMFKEFPEVKQKLWGGHLWNPSYFIATVSEHTAEQVREYIQNQKV